MSPSTQIIQFMTHSKLGEVIPVRVYAVVSTNCIAGHMTSLV